MPGLVAISMSSSSGANGVNGMSPNSKGFSSSSQDARHADGIQQSSNRPVGDFATSSGAVAGGANKTDSIRIPGLSNGTRTTTESRLSANGIQDMAMGGFEASGSSLLDLPPELFHLTTGYISMGSLIERVMQQSFVELTALVDELSQKQVLLPDTASMNGASNGSSNGIITHVKNNQEKKIRWLDWIRPNREKFIKIMIISEWAKRNNDSIHVLIDLKNWADTQDQAFYDTAIAIGELKRNLFAFRLRNPDIKTALEVLATGKDSRMPDLGMLPLPSLTTEKMLKTLQDMNTLLRIRLNLHEELPWHLKRWKVSDGRATFTFPDEFEFDITIADEDHSKQMYFVDMRFLFQPAPVMGNHHIRDALQHKSDEALANSGVSGCFDFLRNFVLTHKITTLQTQATDLAKTSWTKTLKVEMIHRWLIVQYWVNDRYPKSWIEIGISSEADKKSAIPGRVELPQLRLRWRQFGKLQDVEGLKIDLGNLSLETLLKKAIARHTLKLLQQTQLALRDAAHGSSSLRMRLEHSEDEPAECKLHLRLEASTAVVLGIEPITGRLYLQPASEIFGRSQYRLAMTKDPVKDTPIILGECLCLELISRITTQATINNWEPANDMRFTLEYLKKQLDVNVVQYAFFRPAWWKKHVENWLILATVNLDGLSWRAVEISHDANTKHIREAYVIAETGTQCDVTFDHFSQLEQASTRYFTYSHTIQRFKELKIAVKEHHIMQAMPGYNIPDRQRIKSSIITTLNVPAADVVKSLTSMAKPFSPSFQLLFGRCNEATGKITAIVRGMLPWTAQLKDMVPHPFDLSVSFSDKGNFTLHLEATVGESLHTEMIQKLNLLVQSTRLLTALKSQRMAITASTIGRITFQYPRSSSTDTSKALKSSHEASHRCEITFSTDSATPPSARFLPLSSNPQNRIRDNLCEILAKKSVKDFIFIIHLTLPVLRALQNVEVNGNRIRVWSFMKYRIVYLGASTVFEIVCKIVGNDVEWHIYETKAGHPQQVNQRVSLPRPEGYEDMIREFFSKSEAGRRSLKTMLVCTSEAVEFAIDELDELVRNRIASAPLVSPPQQSAAILGGDQNMNYQQQLQTQHQLQRQQAGRGMPLSMPMGTQAAMAARQYAQMQMQLQQQRMAQQQQQQRHQNQNRAQNTGPGSYSNVVVLD